jgi:hypothetical protein
VAAAFLVAFFTAAAFYLFHRHAVARRESKKSLAALGRLLHRCTLHSTNGRRWRMCGEFRCRKFEIFQLDRSAIASIGSRCAIRLFGDGPDCRRRSVAFEICRRSRWTLVRQILGDALIPICDRKINGRVAVRCSDWNFAAEFFRFGEYGRAVGDLWSGAKARGTLRLRRGAITYGTAGRTGEDFIGEMGLALGLMCDMHDFLRSRLWRS